MCENKRSAGELQGSVSGVGAYTADTANVVPLVQLVWHTGHFAVAHLGFGQKEWPVTHNTRSTYAVDAESDS